MLTPHDYQQERIDAFLLEPTKAALIADENKILCAGDGCDRAPYSRGMCLKHYKRWWRNGDMNTVARAWNDITADEHLRLIDWTVTDSGCWEWNGRTGGRMGYGEIDHDGRQQPAHRLAYQTWVGPVVPDEVVRHKCDNPPCINPDHLEPGTHAENAHDRDSRGRQGANQWGTSKKWLTNEEVAEIRALMPVPRGGQKLLAERYGVSATTISKIGLGKVRRLAYAEVDAA